jgi:hypothetical protein
VLTILEGLGNFIEHGISFLFLPTDFQALSFTSPQMICINMRHLYFSTEALLANLKWTKCLHQFSDAGI